MDGGGKRDKALLWKPVDARRSVPRRYTIVFLKISQYGGGEIAAY
jgi:hypothetical protein